MHIILITIWDVSKKSLIVNVILFKFNHHFLKFSRTHFTKYMYIFLINRHHVVWQLLAFESSVLLLSHRTFWCYNVYAPARLRYHSNSNQIVANEMAQTCHVTLHTQIHDLVALIKTKIPPAYVYKSYNNI